MTELEEEQAIREITQEVALAALGRTDFFKYGVFQGGTSLRIFYGLNRFSIDLDFWITQNPNTTKLFEVIKQCLTQNYILTDAANKFNTLLFEIKTNRYPRRLKIEVRKESKQIQTEPTIAYSKYSNLQVLLPAVSLPGMMQAKIDAFLNRKEIRDVFDIEFMLKKGIPLPGSQKQLKQMLQEINGLSKKDYTVKLGSLLDSELRKYYTTENFKILTAAIQEKLV